MRVFSQVVALVLLAIVVAVVVKMRMGAGDGKGHSKGPAEFNNPVYDQAPDNGAGELTFMQGSVHGNAGKYRYDSMALFAATALLLVQMCCTKYKRGV